jgi:hypothetical protein
MPQKKQAADVVASSPEDLERLREALRGGPFRVAGTLLTADGPLGQPCPMRETDGGWAAYATADREAVVTGLRIEAEIAGEAISADVRLPPLRDADPEADGAEVPRKVAIGGVAHAFVPDEPGLGQQAEAP